MFVFISRKTGKKIFMRKKGRIKQISFIHPFLIYEFPDKKIVRFYLLETVFYHLILKTMPFFCFVGSKE